MDRRSQDRVQWVYSSQTNSELSQRYDEWAEDYDKDLSDVFGWIAPNAASEYLAKYVEPEALVLDAGAGTGLVGVALLKHGFNNLTAMDLSEGMLKEARNKNVYQKFDQMVLGEHLDYLTDTFDAVISVGVMTLGHAGPESLDELIRITKPRGYIVFTIRTDVYTQNGFKEKQEELELKNIWEKIEVSDRFRPMPSGEPDVFHCVWVYRVRD